MRSLYIEDRVDPIVDSLAQPIRLARVFGWFGTLLAIAGGLLLSLNIEFSIYAWVVCTVASLVLVLWSLYHRLGSQVALHGTYLIINFNGIINHLL